MNDNDFISWLDYHDKNLMTLDVSVHPDICLEQAELVYDLAFREKDPKKKFLLSGIANMLFDLHSSTLSLIRTQPYPNTGRY